ncbi:MAG: sigma-70 family RNA polymerase sigma factor [Kofleriaceae bacterium]
MTDRVDCLSCSPALEALQVDMGQTIAMTDGELLEASRRGERDAFGALVERYQDVVCAVTYSRTRDQALSEDVAQDTFIAAWRQLDQLREPGRLRSWLCGIARNLASKARRRSDRETAVDEPAAISDRNPFDDVCAAEAERVVTDALSRVPDTYRDVLVLYYREQWSARDIADALGLTEPAVAQRLARGRQYLAEGVSTLVETSLRNHRKRRDLAPGVLAALPPIVPSQVEASPSSSSGGTMLKIALVAAVLATVGTTAYVVKSRGADAPASVTASASKPVESPALATSAPALPSAPAPRDPKLPAEAVHAPAPDRDETIDRVKRQQLGLDRGPSRGPANAPVEIVAFTDMLCPYCAKSLGALDQLVDEYPGKLRIIVKQMPVHKKEKSDVLGEALYAAEAQEKFWELHDLMLAKQDELSIDTLPALAKEAGLDMAKFKTAMDKHAYADTVASDAAAAKAIDAKAVPTFVINGRRITGAMPIEAFRTAIDAALAEAK